MAGEAKSRPRRPKKPHRGIWVYAVWALVALVSLPIVVAVVAAVFFPTAWKQSTDQNVFPVLAGEGMVGQMMAWETPALLPGPVNEKGDNVASTLWQGGRRLVFARRDGADGKANLFTTRFNGEAWSPPKPVETANSEFNETEPSVTSDGKHLLFASDRPDGSGGYDIWVAPWTERGWGSPVNLGPKVNSEFNERGPCMNLAIDKLYFSSDRPKVEMSDGDRRRFWQSLVLDNQPGDFDIFVADDVVLSDFANPLRDRRYRESIIAQLGGSAETEKAVHRALNWFAKHQEKDGRWDSGKHGGQRRQDIAATGFAILCYYGWGARHDRPGEYQKPLKKAVDWLIKECNRRNGDMATRVQHGMYGHAVGTIALAEAYGVTKDPALRPPLEKAVRLIVNTQDHRLGGWRYTPQRQRGDTSVVGWQIMALRSARIAGIHVPEQCFTLAKRWMNHVGGGRHKGLYGYQNATPTPPMTAEGMFVQQMLELSPSDPRQKESAAYLAKNIPSTREPLNLYYCYYGALSLYQHQGEEWKRWNAAVKPLLLASQTKKGAHAGTWTPQRWQQSGRAVGTAMATLSLEVYYRYLPMYNIEGHGAEAVRKSADRDDVVVRPKPVRKTPTVFLAIPLTARRVEALASPSHEHGIQLSPQGDYAYFCSNRVGGFGGYDIYRSRILYDILQVPENVADPINTEANETSPTVSDLGRQMVFSSDRGHDGKEIPLLYHTKLIPEGGLQKFMTLLRDIKWWLIAMVIGLITLAAMVMWFVKAENRGQASLLAKCLAGSVGVHGLLLLALSLWMIGAALKAAGGDPMEITIDADALASEKLALDIREQVADIQATPEPIRVDSRREPMPMPTLKPMDLAPSAMAKAKFKVSKSDLEMEAREIKTAEPQAKAQPQVHKTEHVRFAADNVQLEMRQPVAERRPKNPAVRVANTFTVSEVTPTMSKPLDRPVPNRTEPAETTPVMPKASTAIKADTRPPVESPSAAKPQAPPRPTKLINFAFAAEANPLEQRPASAKRAASAAAAVGGSMAVTAATPTMSTDTGRPISRRASGVARAAVAPMAASGLEVKTDPSSMTGGASSAARAARATAKPTKLGGVDFSTAGGALERRPAGTKKAAGSAATVGGSMSIGESAPSMSAAVGRPLAHVGPGAVGSTVAPKAAAGVNMRADPSVLSGSGPTLAPSDHAKPATKGLGGLTTAAGEGELERRPAGAKGAKTSAAAVGGAMTVGESAPAMSGHGGGPLAGPSAGAAGTATAPKALAGLKMRGDPSVLPAGRPSLAQPGEAKTDTVRMGKVEFSPGEGQLEQPGTGDKRAKTAAAAVGGGAVAIGEAAPVMSSAVGAPLPGRLAPAGGAPAGQGVKAVELAMGVTKPGDAQPRLIGPGGIVTRRTPRLDIFEDPGLEAPADRKSNYALRQKANRNRVLKRLGGSDKTEAAIGMALDWFTKNQESDGRWSCKKHGGAKGHDNATTALAMLCYFGWGATHTEAGVHQKTLAKAVQWLLSRMGEDGDFTAKQHNGMYDQGIATMAIAEAYGVTKDPALREPARRAARFVINAQNTEKGGWRYRPGQDSDTSVVGWQVMALTSARMAGLRVPQRPFQHAERWLKSVSHPRHPGRFGYQNANPTHTMTAEGMFCLQLIGVRPSDPRMNDAAEFIKTRLPSPTQRNYYYWYYGCLAMYQHKGPVWEMWNKEMKKVLLSSQVRQGPDAGSWNRDGEWSKADNGGGRIMSTALSTLSLEVYYRYLPIYTRTPGEAKKRTTPLKP